MCFSCCNFGHISAYCPAKIKRQVNPVQMYIEVSFDNEQVSGLLDTGSDVPLLRNLEYRQLNKPRMLPNSIKWTDFGQNVKKTIASFGMSITIN